MYTSRLFLSYRWAEYGTYNILRRKARRGGVLALLSYVGTRDKIYYLLVHYITCVLVCFSYLLGQEAGVGWVGVEMGI